MKKATKLPWQVSSNSAPHSIDPHKLETEHVKKVYDNIADQWSGTRYKAWPKVENFIKQQPKGTFFADIGCGNGKNIPASNDIGFSIGTDISFNLLKVAKKNVKCSELSAMDILNLPLRSNLFDSCICIAVLHHLSTESRRLQAISECCRILKPGGTALFYAWAQEQDTGSETGVSGHRFSEKDVLVPWHLREDKLEPEVKKQISEDVEHTEYDEKKASIVFQRYCHVYSKSEWENLFNSTKGISIDKVYWDTGNWAAIVIKSPAKVTDSIHKRLKPTEP